MADHSDSPGAPRPAHTPGMEPPRPATEPGGAEPPRTAQSQGTPPGQPQGMEPARPARQSAGGPSEAEPTAQELKSTAEQVAGAVASDLREGVAEGAARVRDEAAARTEEAKQGIARQVAATAEALDAAARDMDESSLQRGLLREASRGLAGMAEALQGRSMGELVSQVSEFGRRNPVPFLGGAALAGFALARLAVASERADEGPVPGDWPHDRPTTAPGHAMETPTTRAYKEGALE